MSGYQLSFLTDSSNIIVIQAFISYFSYLCLYLLVKVNPKTFQPPTQNEPHTILRVDANREGMVPDDHLRYCVKIKYCASIIYLQIKY